MSVWSPTHAQFTVLRARNLISKGKAGSNDVYVTIQLGKEKYQTSTIKNARNPEWFEECDLPIPHLHSEIEVCVLHRGMLSDDFLGYAAIPLWEQKIQDHPKAQWVQLRHKPSKEPDNKNRGEIEVKVTFHCHNRVDFYAGLKKKSSSLRNLATVMGDRLKFSRSKSFRENRKDPEGGKTDRNQSHNSSLQEVPEPRVYVKPLPNPAGNMGPSTPLTAVSFPALDFDHSWKGETTEEGLTRSYSMSATCIKAMSLDRKQAPSLTDCGQETGVLRSQLLRGINTSNRHSMVELPSTQAPPPYQVRPSSQDDMNITTSTAPHPHHQRTVSCAPYFESVLRRDHARYESIRERTEPETSSSEEEPRLSRPPRRGLKPRPRPLSEEMTVEIKDFNTANTLNSSQCASTREGTPVSVDSESKSVTDMQRSETITNGSLQFERGGLALSQRKQSGSVGELSGNGAVKLRKRTKRERLRMYHQGGRRFTVQGLESRLCGLYDDSMSDANDISKKDVPDDLFSVYRNLTKEELLQVVIQNKAQLIRKDQYIKDLESYIDNLLVRVMETQPRILHRPPMHQR